jgi:hypothetical protein
MPYVPTFRRATSRKAPVGAVVVMTMFLALLGGFLFDTAGVGLFSPPAPAELRT